MTHKTLRQRFAPTMLAALLAISGIALADPPSRVARLSYLSGSSSFSPGGERDWVRANVNRPLVTGDRLWVENGARAELQLGAAAIRVGGATSVTLLNIDDRTAQIQLTQGTLSIRVRKLDRDQVMEIDTPNLAYSIKQPGTYRVVVDADGGSTTVSVRGGLANVYGEGRAFIVRDKQTYRFYGNGLRDYQTYAVWRQDDLDRFATERDRRWDNSPSRRFVSAEMIGYEDLDQNGSWRKVNDYGNVWVPNKVSRDWAPYRDGHWSWVEPWGWTWVDDAAWGFAPSHYGRWAHLDIGWAWVPGPATVRPVYAPALVAFVGGDGPRGGSGGGNVGWFPLAPREVYRPSYAASREYFTNVNTSNTYIPNRTVIVNQYNSPPPASVTYVNQGVPGAVVAMLAVAFAQSRPVERERVQVTREMFSSGPPRAVANVAPSRVSIVGGAPAQTAKPPEAAQARAVVAQVKPPPPPVAFESRQKTLADNAGKPHDAAAVAAVKPATPAPAAAAPAITIVPPVAAVAAPMKPASTPMPVAGASAPQAATPANAPAPAAVASQPERPASGGGRGGFGARGERPAAPGASRPAPQAAPQAQPAPAPAPAAAPAPAPATPSAPPARPTPPAPMVPPVPAAAPAPAPAAQGASAPARGREQRSEERTREDRGARPGASAGGRPAFTPPAAAPVTPPTPAPAPAPAPAAAPKPAPAPAPVPAPAAAPARPTPPPAAPPAPEAARPQQPPAARNAPPQPPAAEARPAAPPVAAQAPGARPVPPAQPPAAGASEARPARGFGARREAASEGRREAASEAKGEGRKP